MRQSKLLHGIEWVLFDAVGTLIYPDPPVAEVYHAAGRRLGSRLSVEEVRERFHAALAVNQSCGEPTSEAIERERWQRIVGGVLDDVAQGHQALFESLWQHFAEPENWRVYEDVAAVAELRARGYRLGIASNFDSRLIRIAATHPPLAACEVVFVSSSVGFTKPDRRFFNVIEGRLGVEAGKIALVGDDEVSDVRGATEAGWQAVQLLRNADEAEPGTIRRLAELL